MYEGALDALANPTNPDHFALAAHGLRELMEKLPEVLDVPMPAHREPLKVKANEFQDKWEAARQRITCVTVNSDPAEIDGPLPSLVRIGDEFVAWYEDRKTGRGGLPRRRS
jgi:hypothetical protein